MKKFAKLMLAAASIALLTGCKGSGKAGWTDDEKKIFKDYLLFELPFYGKNLAVSLDETNGLIVAKGDAASADDVKEYAKLLTSKDNGYVEDAAVSEDLFDLYDLKNAVQLRKSQAQYVVQDVVAIGLDKDNKLTVVETLNYVYWGSFLEADFFESGSYYQYSDQLTQEVLNEANDECFTLANTFEGEDGKEIETFKAGDFVYPEHNSAWEGFGVTEFNFLKPWTDGNCYSEDFLVNVEFTYIGADSSDNDAYVAALAEGGYAIEQAATADYPYDVYTKEFGDIGVGVIEVLYSDEFFTDGTSALSVCYYYIAL